MKKIKPVYIVLTHHYQPVPGGKWEVEEKCEFVDRLTDKHRIHSSIIIDYRNGTLYKNRNGSKTDEAYALVLESLLDRYPSEMLELDKALNKEKKIESTEGSTD